MSMLARLFTALARPLPAGPPSKRSTGQAAVTFSRGVLLVAVTAIAVHAAPASAEPPLRDVGRVSMDPSSGGVQVIADRTRVAYMPDAGRVRVITEDLVEVASVLEPGCSWRSFGGGALLWACPPAAPAPAFSGEPTVFPIDELEGGQRTVLGPPALTIGAHGESPSWWAVGRRWMTVYYDNSPDHRAYINRTTGTSITARTSSRVRSDTSG